MGVPAHIEQIVDTLKTLARFRGQYLAADGMAAPPIGDGWTGAFSLTYKAPQRK